MNDMTSVKEQLKPIILKSLRITDLTPEDLRDDQPLSAENLKSTPSTYSNWFWRLSGISASNWCRPTSTRHTSKVLTLWLRSSNPKWRKPGPDIYNSPIFNSPSSKQKLSKYNS